MNEGHVSVWLKLAKYACGRVRRESADMPVVGSGERRAVRLDDSGRSGGERRKQGLERLYPGPWEDPSPWLRTQSFFGERILPKISRTSGVYCGSQLIPLYYQVPRDLMPKAC